MACAEHPLEWTSADVKAWLASQGCDFPGLPSLSGPILWNLELDELLAAISDDERAQLQAAVQRLRRRCEDQALLDALRMQEEELEDADVMQALWEEHQPALMDRLYGDAVQDADLKRCRIEHMDMELAARLQQDWNDEGVLVAAKSIADDEAQARLDADLARCITQLDDGSAHVILEQYGHEAEKSQTQNVVGDEHWITEGINAAAAAAAEVGMPSCSEAMVPDSATTKVMCCACTEEFADFEIAALKCEHKMCGTCIRRLVRNAMSDVSLIPVRCCSIPLPEGLVREALDSAEFIQFLKMTEEKQARNKMFCPNAACSQFINLDIFFGIEGSGELDCPGCDQKLCVKCRSAWHVGQTCAEKRASTGDVQLDEIAAKMGWKQCPECTVYVNLRVGCNHMTCLCGHEFCFACLASWVGGKTCACPLWDEQNLIEEGNRRERAAEEHLGRQLFAHERHQVQHQLFVDNREANECRHHREGFTYREFRKPATKKGLRQCDNCENMITAFCYQCNGCSMRFCHTCRFNRKLT